MPPSIFGVFVLFGVILIQSVLVKGLGPWQEWGPCSKPCGRGERWRTRHCSNPLLPFQCHESESCNAHPCTRNEGCRGSAYVYNKCEERCRCVDGSLVNCTRIRKEFTTMTRQERKRYINTVKIASTHPKYKKEYSELVTLHRTNFYTQIHNRSTFLPWHRWYILQYENFYRLIDCRITLPYWNWVSVSGRPWDTTPSDLWYTGSSGLGGNGSPPGGCVNTGPFKPPWQLVPSADPPLCLKRNFSGNPPDEVELNLLLNIPPTPHSNFLIFEDLLRDSFHNTIHCLIGGTMCTIDTASAPEFLMHHGMVDKIWNEWQSRSHVHRTVYFSNQTVGMLVTGGVIPKDVLDNTALPGGIRVEYEEKQDPEFLEISKKLRFLSNSQLRNIARVGGSPLNQEGIKLFRINNKTKNKIMKMNRKELKSHVRKRPSSNASAMDRKLGFSAEQVEDIKSAKVAY